MRQGTEQAPKHENRSRALAAAAALVVPQGRMAGAPHGSGPSAAAARSTQKRPTNDPETSTMICSSAACQRRKHLSVCHSSRTAPARRRQEAPPSRPGQQRLVRPRPGSQAQICQDTSHIIHGCNNGLLAVQSSYYRVLAEHLPMAMHFGVNRNAPKAASEKRSIVVKGSCIFSMRV
jgi:hypothetical protein